MPASVAQAGPEAAKRFLEFLAAQIRNPKTRASFPVGRGAGLGLRAIRTLHMAGWVEQLGGSAPRVKQKLAAVRMLFDWLVMGGALAANPAAAVRRPKHVGKVGKTPVL